jgi:hypothetical protein
MGECEERYRARKGGNRRLPPRTESGLITDGKSANDVGTGLSNSIIGSLDNVESHQDSGVEEQEMVFHLSTFKIVRIKLIWGNLTGSLLSHKIHTHRSRYNSK